MRGESKGIHGKQCNCTCDVCGNSILSVCTTGYTTFQDLIDLWMSIMCPVRDSTFHALNCLKGKCDSCGIDMLITCLNENDQRIDKMMSWKCYEKVIHGKARASLDNKVLRLQHKDITTHVFLSYLKPRLQKFITKNSVVHF